MKKRSVIYYLTILVASVGYYYNLENEDSFRHVFGLIFIIGLGLLLGLDYRIYKNTRNKLIFLDLGFILWTVVIPRVDLGYGLSRLIMALGGAIYALLMSEKKLKK